jgi:amino acid transporter
LIKQANKRGSLILICQGRSAAVIVGSSRQTYAFARDGAMPCSKWLNTLNASKVPANAVWFNVAFAAILGIPYLFSEVAFETIVSINTISSNISYFIPIWLRITMARKKFQKGPFHMGSMSIPCGIVACAWIAFTSVLFILPTVSPTSFLFRDKTTYSLLRVEMASNFKQYELCHHSICVRDWFGKFSVRNFWAKVVYGTCA